MARLDKLLKKFSRRERKELERIVEKILGHDLAGLDCKKLKGLRNIFRVRKGVIRIIFELGTAQPKILSIERRREDIYKF